MDNPLKSTRMWVELAVVAVLGGVFVIWTQWCDPDSGMPYTAWLALFGGAFSFGLFGRAPVILLAPVFSLAAGVDGMLVCTNGFRILKFYLQIWFFEVGMNILLIAVVLIPLGLGRGLRKL